MARCNRTSNMESLTEDLLFDILICLTSRDIRNSARLVCCKIRVSRARYRSGPHILSSSHGLVVVLILFDFDPSTLRILNPGTIGYLYLPPHFEGSPDVNRFVHLVPYDGGSTVLTLHAETEVLTESRVPVPLGHLGENKFLVSGGKNLTLVVALRRLSWDVWEMIPETWVWRKAFSVGLEKEMWRFEEEVFLYEDDRLIPVGWLNYPDGMVFAPSRDGEMQSYSDLLESLTEDLLFDILIRLTSRDICNSAKLVCRKWDHLTRSRDFTCLHFHRAANGLLLQNTSVAKGTIMEKYYRKVANIEEPSTLLSSKKKSKLDNQNSKSTDLGKNSKSTELDKLLENLPSDPAHRKRILDYDPNIRDQVRQHYLLKGPCQPRSHKFPQRDIYGTKRRESKIMLALWVVFIIVLC
ncbi:TTF-type zinc finger protein with HAT dimerisation domain [Striga hermonthica]|uniref:TTF-type zinc finger protein with HAT dimerisation domain n=1 Tax=Striga hermonthica TaxID=68872 RepID=A0A9N7N1B6_STRHE|nr:TTF-type zinc finger protein with HAT dimerisation domain [Striga hermonthica]